MADVNASLNILIDSSQAQAELRRLQSQISAFNKSLATMDAGTGQMLARGINATKMFNAQMVPAASGIDRFTTALEKNKLTLGEYTRYAASQLPGLSRVYRKEFDTMQAVATDRVKKMQAQYIALGKSAKGVQEALQITPTGLAKGYATDLAVAAQRQQLFNKMIDDGSTKLLNWGKNTQWAGRQLMVGFSLPLAALGAAAAQAFMELDKMTTAFERVYGDLSTSTAEMERNKAAVIDLGKEYTKYGIAVKDTMELASRVAATGQTNEDLLRSTEQTLRFATLGQMDYNTALDATISLQSAFGIASQDLAQNIDYLNAVENQTVLTIQDVAAAIPRVAPVIKGLGGDVKDLTVFLTAMREGGVTAEQGANALKSGLASLINPTDRALISLGKLGINLQGIIDTNRGDLLGTIQEFGKALNAVGDFEQQQALEQIFGKYQYARMGALFKNIANDASQAARAIDLTNMSVEELAMLSDKELSKIEESTTVKFQKSMEQLKLAIAPLGEAFLKGVMPIMDALSNIAEAFNNLPDPVKNAFAVVTGVVAGLGPVFLMTAGLIGNGVANIIKGIQFFRKRMAGIKGDSSAFQYLATAELEARAASEALEGSVTTLTESMLLQKGAVAALTREYQRYAAAAGAAGAAAAIRGRGVPRRMATGGTVPGSGSGDKIPALLEPGETVVTKKASQRFGPVLAAMNAGTLPGFAKGNTSGRQSLDAAHLTSAFAQDSVQWTAAIGQLTPALQEFATKFPQMVKVVSKLTATLPSSLNQALQKGATISRFEKGWAAGGPEKLFGAAAMGGANVQDPKIQAALKRLEKSIGDRAVALARQTADQKIDDALLEKAQMQVIAEYEKLDDSARMAAASLKNAASQVGQVRIQPSAAQLRELHGQGLLSQQGQSILYKGSEIARSSASDPFNFGYAGKGTGRAGRARPASNIDIDGGLATSARTQKLITTVATKNATTYKKASQSVLATPTADPFIQSTMTSRNSPHPKAGQYGAEDAKAYMLAQQATFASMMPAATPKQAYKAQQSQQRRMATDAARMRSAGMSDTQIYRAERKLAEAKIRQAQIAQSRAIAEEKGLALENQINVANTEVLAATKKQSLLSRAAGGLGRRAGTAGMLLGMGSMVPFMAQNDQGKFMGMDANALGMGMAGGGMALDLLSMAKFAGAGGIISKVALALGAFAGPLAIATAAVTAAGVAFYAWRKSVDESARKAAEFGANVGGTANALNKMASMLGTMTPVQRRAQIQVGDLTATQQENYGQYQSMIESDAGQELIKGLKEATSADRFKMLGDYVTSAVAAGIMEYDFAEGFVKTVSTQLGDAVLGKNVLGALSEFKNISSNTEAMLSIANKRLDSANQNADMQQVLGGGGVSNEQASSAIGQALQGIQDFGNAAAVAEQEFKDGTITYADYIDALNESTSAQNMYTQAIIFALQNSGDQGGTKQGLIEQLQKMGFNQEGQAEGMVNFMDNVAPQAGASARQGAAEKVNAAIDARLSELETEIADAQKAGNVQDINTLQAEQRRLQENRVVLDTQGNYFSGGASLNMAELIPGSESQAIADYVLQSGRAAEEEAQKSGYEVGANMIAAIIQGMDPKLAVDTAELVATGYGEVGAAAKKAFDTAKAAGVDAVTAFENAAVMAREANPETATKGITNNEGYAAALGTIGGGTEMATIDRIMQGLPEQNRQGFANFLQTNQQRLSGESGKNFATMSDAATTALGPQAQDLIQSEAWVKSAEGTQQSVDEIISSVQELGKALQDNEDLKTQYIDFIMKQDPADLDTKLPELTDKLTLFQQKVPEDIQKNLTVDYTLPENLDKLTTEEINTLGYLSDIVADMPEGEKEFATNMMLMENGKPKDPVDFARDVKDYQKVMGKLKSEKKTVRKKAAIELLTMITGPNGEKLSPEEAKNAFQKILDDTGLTEAEFLQLPTDTISKIFALNMQIDPEFAGMSAETLQGIIDYKKIWGYDTSREEAALEILNRIKGLAAKGLAGGGNDLPSGSSGGGGGGGGGGEKANPFKDLKETLLNQIKMFADSSATLKNLLKSKYGFFNLLRASKGIDDKILAAGFSPELSEYLMGLDPKDALKLLKKFTDKRGNANKMGRQFSQRMEAAAISESISTMMTEARASTQGSRYQALALNSLVGRGAASDAISSIAGNAEAARGYMALTESVNDARKAYDEYVKKANKDGRVSDRERERIDKLAEAWKKARKDLQDFIDTMAKAQREEGAVATAMSMQDAESMVGDTQGALYQAQQAGFTSPEMTAALATGEYNDYIQTADSARKTLEDLLANPVKKGEKGWKKYRDELAAAQAAVKVYGATAEETLQNIENHLNNQDWNAYLADPFGFLAEKAQGTMDNITALFEQEYIKLEDLNDAQFQADFGMDKEAAQEIIENNKVILAGYEAQKTAIEGQINAENLLIKAHEREKKQWQDKIDTAQDAIDGWQRSIDLYNRDISERNHQADLINHELELMSKAEEQINKTYDDRMKALDKVEQINQRIVQSQQDQLALSQALSTGDIYAATQAAQQMRANEAAAAVQNARDSLTQSRDSQLENLRSSTGLSRLQMEEQLWNINQQNYQTGLLIYGLEDKIYAKNQEIYGYKVEIDKIDASIKEHTDKIWQYEGQILEIEKTTAPMIAQNALWQSRLDASNAALEDSKSDLLIRGMTLKQYEAVNRRMQTQLKAQKAANDLANDQLQIWINIGQAIAAAREAMAGDLAAVRRGDFAHLVDSGVPIEQFFNADTETYDLEGLKKWIIDSATQDMEQLLQGGIDFMNPMNASIDQIISDNIISVKNTRWENGKAVDQNGNPIDAWVLNDTGATIKRDGTDWINGMLWAYKNGKPTSTWRMLSTGGGVDGEGSRDSVAAMLTPGEFVVKKSMVDKYGMPMFEKINQGSFSIPKYNIGFGSAPKVRGQSRLEAKIAPVYNSYKLDVNVSGTNASADEIANVTMSRIRNMQNMQIRSARGTN